MWQSCDHHVMMYHQQGTSNVINGESIEDAGIGSIDHVWFWYWKYSSCLCLFYWGFKMFTFSYIESNIWRQANTWLMGWWITLILLTWFWRAFNINLLYVIAQEWIVKSDWLKLYFLISKSFDISNITDKY